jgi:uridine kinase
MPRHVTVEETITLIEAGVQPPLIAIDGLPCSGKTTTVDRLKDRMDLECIYLDDFVLPERDWPPGIKPSFPFPFIRYDEFVNAIQTLASSGACTYKPFDWDTFEISADLRTVSLSKPVVIDGVSSLNPILCDLYGFKVFVESDRATTLQAALDRGAEAGPWSRQWRELFLPSVDIYMETQPQKRADVVIAGRGVRLENGDDSHQTRYR